MAANPKHLLTPEEYLTFERGSVERHEYLNGEMFLVSGGSKEHALIGANGGGELRNLLKGKGCRVYSNDFRVSYSGDGALHLS